MSGNILAVTNRSLCPFDFYEQIGRIAASPAAAVILREKDLPLLEYERLAARVLEICRRAGKRCILHTHLQAAERLRCDAVHLPLPVLRSQSAEKLERFSIVGASVHSAAEAVEAETMGATYLTAGHVFDTGCKPDLPGRGMHFLREVCKAVSIPVYAIGGITPSNLPLALEAGAAGGCMMSSLMRSPDPSSYLVNADSMPPK